MRTADAIEGRKSDKSSPATRQRAGGDSKRGNAARIARWRWKQGQSGNPSGKRRNDLSREIARAVFENNPDAIYRAMTRAILQGSAYAFKEVADRGYGKVQNSIEVTGQDGGLADLSNEELDRRINQLLAKLRPEKQRKQK